MTPSHRHSGGRNGGTVARLGTDTSGVPPRSLVMASGPIPRVMRRTRHSTSRLSGRAQRSARWQMSERPRVPLFVPDIQGLGSVSRQVKSFNRRLLASSNSTGDRTPESRNSPNSFSRSSGSLCAVREGAAERRADSTRPIAGDSRMRSSCGGAPPQWKNSSLFRAVTRMTVWI